MALKTLKMVFSRRGSKNRAFRFRCEENWLYPSAIMELSILQNDFDQIRAQLCHPLNQISHTDFPAFGMHLMSGKKSEWLRAPVHAFHDVKIEFVFVEMLKMPVSALP